MSARQSSFLRWPAVGLCALSIVLAIPPLAQAQGSQGPGNPLSPGLPQSQTPAPTAPATTTPATPNPSAPSPSAPVVTNPSSSSSGGGFTGTDAAVIAIGAIIVLGGISFFIWRDARRRAPLRRGVTAATAGGGGRARSGSKAPPKPRKLSPAERRRRKRGRAR